MRSFLETYGIAIFTLVLMAILIAFASPIGKIIKTATNTKIRSVDKICTNEIKHADRLAEPTDASDNLWCGLYSDGELIIDQNNFTMDASRGIAVEPKQVSTPKDITSDVSQIKIATFQNAVKPTSCGNWFRGCANLTKIKNIKNLYTNECKNMAYMFEGCKSLINVDVSNFDTSKVANMYFMFKNCWTLTTLDVSNFDTSNVLFFNSMFEGCKSLTDLNINNFYTTKATMMSWMFKNCTSLKHLYMSNLDMSNVTDMPEMFLNCNSLVSIDATQETKTKILNNDTGISSSIQWTII